MFFFFFFLPDTSSNSNNQLGSGGVNYHHLNSHRRYDGRGGHGRGQHRLPPPPPTHLPPEPDNSPPSILEHPASLVAAPGEPATLTCGAAGRPTPRVEWWAVLIGRASRTGRVETTRDDAKSHRSDRIRTWFSSSFVAALFCEGGPYGVNHWGKNFSK